MNTKKNLFAILLISMMVLPVLTKAQANGRNMATVGEPKGGWQPVQLSDGKNIMGGVHFFNQKSECNASQVVLMKVTNTNAYSTRVSYQVSAESPVVNINVPASITVEGSCNASDANTAKLMINFPSTLTADEMAKMKTYMQSHISVSKVQ